MSEQTSPCGHPAGDVWFDRTLCGVCDGMHYFCTHCGAQQDPCRTEVSA